MNEATAWLTSGAERKGVGSFRGILALAISGEGNRTLVNITSLDWGSCAARIKLSVDLADVSRHREGVVR